MNQHPLDILPIEIWLNVRNFLMDKNDLRTLRLVSKTFSEFKAPCCNFDLTKLNWLEHFFDTCLPVGGRPHPFPVKTKSLINFNKEQNKILLLSKNADYESFKLMLSFVLSGFSARTYEAVKGFAHWKSYRSLLREFIPFESVTNYDLLHKDLKTSLFHFFNSYSHPNLSINRSQLLYIFLEADSYVMRSSGIYDLMDDKHLDILIHLNPNQYIPPYFFMKSDMLFFHDYSIQDVIQFLAHHHLRSFTIPDQIDTNNYFMIIYCLTSGSINFYKNCPTNLYDKRIYLGEETFWHFCN